MAQRAKARLLKLIHGYCRIESDNMTIVDGIMRIIYEYHRIATWSNVYKGTNIELSEDDTKAECTQGSGHSIRADFCINRGAMISWRLECYTSSAWCYFYGVISSKQENFNECPDSGELNDCYGVDDDINMIYQGAEAIDIEYENGKPIWCKPQFPEEEVFTLIMIADWRDKQCKLSIVYDGKKLNETSDEYTLLLPELEDEYVWYPCVTPYYKGAYCIIRYA